ncbi:TonB-dependent receptor [Pseudobacter ginsenosidimutans]|uniref:Outer membrane receptor protein involved in Fe transport n=1 Tax=Pseudobacter ginsenosidimutans TaxID=661488 RepID=A0A4Q7MFI7_9BACT|nr:TonB-dependent receptor [Pseudobacter ginsenosidimutans]RZS67015.1 outer membrane receptor protein involved in Fe transport [Pseudobacter ginsenosidimutans]
MRAILLTLVYLMLILPQAALAQKKPATLSGKVVDENENPLARVSVTILGKRNGVSTSDSGTFTIQAPSDKAFALVFSFTGYKSVQRNFLLSENEAEYVVVRMERGTGMLDSVVVTDQRQRREAGLVLINPKNAINIPAPGGGIESLIKVFVGSNNELTSQYSVRGGNYDENLVYVNDFEIFRPYLVRSGQQEGLSFINPELARNVSFYNGGFQARYGDKMSSVLDIQYKKPKTFGGSAYIGLLEQGLHLEGASKNGKFTYLVGVRNRSNRNLLSSQETKGNYVPSSADLQAQLTYQINQRNSLELLGNISQTKFTLMPEYSQLTSSVFSPLFSANLGLDIFFEGREEDRYRTNMIGLAWIQQLNKKLRLKWMASRFENDEKESIDIMGAYLFGDRSFDKGKPEFGMITNPLGAGVYQNFARNKLNIALYNFSHKGSYDQGKHFIQWGQTVERQSITDKLNEWEYQDSAGYNIPYNPNMFELSKVLKAKADIDVLRLSGYIQDNIIFHDSSDFTLQAGVRYNYNDLNKEFLLSPRIGFSWKPGNWERDIIFRGAAGLYHQPPFYRELRRYDGTINKDLKAQKSWQIAGGMDYNFRSGNRPFRFTAEAYYKNMWDVVPYDIDNVRIRYFGENRAKAYATGLELRLFGELVKDAESWVSLGFMRTREDLDKDTYYDYTLDDNNNPTDSTLKEGGWFRRPSDRLVTFGMFLQDYLATNKNFKVYLNFLYGSNLPYNIPNSVKYRNALEIDPYIRIDIGFSALLLDSEKSNRRSHNPFRNFENIWATLEVFNLIDRDNTISYMLIKDFSNTVFAMPNRLTPRLLNLKLIARF